jgi:hypothetical protein
VDTAQKPAVDKVQIFQERWLVVLNSLSHNAVEVLQMAVVCFVTKDLEPHRKSERALPLSE